MAKNILCIVAKPRPRSSDPENIIARYSRPTPKLNARNIAFPALLIRVSRTPSRAITITIDYREARLFSRKDILTLCGDEMLFFERRSYGFSHQRLLNEDLIQIFFLAFIYLIYNYF